MLFSVHQCPGDRVSAPRLRLPKEVLSRGSGWVLVCLWCDVGAGTDLTRSLLWCHQTGTGRERVLVPAGINAEGTILPGSVKLCSPQQAQHRTQDQLGDAAALGCMPHIGDDCFTPTAILAHEALGLLAAWLHQVSQHQCYLLGLFLFTVSIHNYSPEASYFTDLKEGLERWLGFSLITHPG